MPYSSQVMLRKSNAISIKQCVNVTVNVNVATEMHFTSELHIKGRGTGQVEEDDDGGT